MTTPQPKFDPTILWFQTRRDGFEERYFPKLADLDEYDRQACEAYLDMRARVAIRTLTSLTLAAAGTQQNAADRIIIDRTALSVARNHGLLGSRPLATMLGDPFVLAQLLDHSPQLCRLMARAGFIAVAEFTATTVVRPGNPARPLNELDFELLCALITSRPGEDPSHPLDERSAAAIAVRVLADPSLVIMPEWFTKAQRRETKDWMKKLQDPDFAARHIAELQRDWIDVFIYAWATVEGEGDDDLWYFNFNDS